MNTFELSLDLDKSVGAKQWVTLRQGDKRGTTLQATIYDHGVLVSGSYTCRVSIRHPNRNTYYRETATYSNGVATVTIDETSAASVVGVTEGYFELLQGSTLIASTESFGVRILQSATDGATVGPPYDSAIRDALDELDAATGRISQMVVDATAEYLAAHPEITTTVQDNSVTDAKLIQSGGVLDRVGRLWWRLENLLTNTPAEAESVTVSDAAKTPVAGLTVYGKSTQDGTPTPDAPVAIESVGPNLAVTPYQRFNFTTNRGVTYSQNADGTITARGTATSWAYLDLCNHSDNPFGLERGKTYTFVTSSRSAFVMTITGGTSTSKSRVMTIPETGNWTVGVGVPSGDTIDETFRFSVFEGSVTAQTAVPYNGVGLLTRGRNLLRNTAQSATSHGITFTVNEDGSVHATGTTPSGEQAFITINGAVRLTAGTTYHLSGCPAGGGSSTWRLYLSGTANHFDNGSGVTFTPASDETETAIIRVYGGQTVDFTFYPQLELGSAETGFQPYTESVTAIPLDGHTLRSLPDGTRDEVTVDQYGHVTLIERIRSIDASSNEWALGRTTPNSHGIAYLQLLTGQTGNDFVTGSSKLVASLPKSTALWSDTTDRCVASNVQTVFYRWPSDSTPTLEEGLADMAAHGVEILTPRLNVLTHDLGTIDPTALVGPDLTAQAVPTAPFALTYERDLNTTLARLEAALATLA